MKNLKNITLLAALVLLFSACGGGSSDDGDSTEGGTAPTSTPSDSWNQSNISGTPTSNTAEDEIDNAIENGNTIGGGVGGTSPAQAGAIPFPALPTNIKLDPKYIPPQ